MLYYTSRNPNGEVEATYSGRFAFIHFRQPEELEEVIALRKGNDLKALWTAAHDRRIGIAARILAHEYTHKHIFAHSPTGLLLNGYRYVVRAQSLFSGSKNQVEDYYRMRTIYLMETRTYHEAMAHSIDDEISEINSSIEKTFNHMINEKHQHTIGEAEMHVRQKWRIQGLYPAKILFLIYRIFGHWLQSNFAVRHSVSNGEEFQLGGFSDRGIANDIYIVRPDEPSYKRLLKKLLLTLIVRPVAQRESHQKHFDWYWSGQRAQFQTLRDIYQMEYDDFWQEVLCPNIHFIMEWSGIPHDQYGTLIEFYEDTLLLPNKVDFLKKWKEQLNQWMTESAFRIFISFFYQHGN